jgi:hypothetical protein
MSAASHGGLCALLAPVFGDFDLEPGASLGILLDGGGEVAGAASFRRFTFGRQRCMFLDRLGVLAPHSSTRVVPRMLAALLCVETVRNRMRPVAVAGLTDTPLLYAALSELLGEEEVFPYRSQDNPREVRNLARSLAGAVSMGGVLDDRTLVVRELAGGGPLMVRGPLPDGADQRMTDFFERTLRGRGAIMVVGRPCPLAILRHSILKAISRLVGA